MWQYSVSTRGAGRIDVLVTPEWSDAYAADGDTGVTVTVAEDAADESVAVSASARSSGTTAAPSLRLRLPQQADLAVDAAAPGDVRVRSKLEGTCAIAAADGAVELLATVRGARVELAAGGATGDVRVRRLAEAGALRVSARRAVDALRVMADAADVASGDGGVRIGALYAREASLRAAGAGAGVAVAVLHGHAVAETSDGPVALLGVAGSVRVRQRGRGPFDAAEEACRVQFEAARGASAVEADGDVLVELAVPCAPLRLLLQSRSAAVSLPEVTAATPGASGVRARVEGRSEAAGAGAGPAGATWSGTVSAELDVVEAASAARGGSGKVRIREAGDAAAHDAGFYKGTAVGDGSGDSGGDADGASLDVVAGGAISVRFSRFDERAARSARERAALAAAKAGAE
jgi:hypothetical protein